jgi:hypothetical protein
MLEGVDVHVHPLDDDATHIPAHEQQILDMVKRPPEERDMDALQYAMNHNIDHKKQMEQKQQAQVVMQGLQSIMTNLQANAATLQQGAPTNGSQGQPAA